MGHPGQPGCDSNSREPGHVDVVALELARRRAGTLRVHGRLPSRRAPGAGRCEGCVTLSAGIPLVDVRRGTDPHGRAGCPTSLANAASYRSIGPTKPVIMMLALQRG